MSDDGRDWHSVFANLKVLLVECNAAIDAAHSEAALRQRRVTA